MRRIRLILRPEIGGYSNQSIVPRNIICPSCQAEVKEKDIIEKRGSLGCVRCLKI